jgi:hypothetical protein
MLWSGNPVLYSEVTAQLSVHAGISFPDHIFNSRSIFMDGFLILPYQQAEEIFLELRDEDLNFATELTPEIRSTFRLLNAEMERRFFRWA